MMAPETIGLERGIGKTISALTRVGYNQNFSQVSQPNSNSRNYFIQTDIKTSCACLSQDAFPHNWKRGRYYLPRGSDGVRRPVRRGRQWNGWQLTDKRRTNSSRYCTFKTSKVRTESERSRIVAPDARILPRLSKSGHNSPPLPCGFRSPPSPPDSTFKNSLAHIRKSPPLAHTGISLSVFNMKQFTHWSQILTVRRPCPTPAIALSVSLRRTRERLGKEERGGWREHARCSRAAVWSLVMSAALLQNKVKSISGVIWGRAKVREMMWRTRKAFLMKLSGVIWKWFTLYCADDETALVGEVINHL